MRTYLSVDACDHVLDRLAQGYLFLGKDQDAWRVFGEGEDAVPMAECYLDECSGPITVRELALPENAKAALGRAINLCGYKSHFQYVLCHVGLHMAEQAERIAELEEELQAYRDTRRWS